MVREYLPNTKIQVFWLEDGTRSDLSFNEVRPLRYPSRARSPLSVGDDVEGFDAG